MTRIETALFDLGGLNELAKGDTWIHRLDPRTKLITTMAFIVTVASFGKYDVLPMIPFIAYPAVLIVSGDLPLGPIFRRLLLAAPFAILIGIFNPFLDREILVHVGSAGISGGFVSFASILLRFILAVSAALILVASTGFETVCLALVRLKIHRIFVLQLLLLYRYLFVLTEEGLTMVRALRMRSFGTRGMPFKTYGSLVGYLLIRTIDRAQRIFQAMQARGFDGVFRTTKPLRAKWADVAFITVWFAFFLAARMVDIPKWLGELVMEALA